MVSALALTATATLGDKIDSAFYGIDTAIYTAFGSLHCDFMNIVAKLFTSFGDTLFIIPIAVLAVILCFFKKTRKYGIAIAFSVIIGTLLTNIVLKPMVLRIRPYNTLQATDFWEKYVEWYKKTGSLSESDYSFPSGHTTSSFEVATALFACLMANKKKKVAWIPLAVAFLCGCSRIYLVVHYPTDVIAGVFAGVIAGTLGYFIAKLICNIIEKNEKLDSVDLEKKFRNGISKRVAAVLIAVFTVGAFTLSFVTLLTESDEEKCAYCDEYDCNNKAKVDDEDYPAIDGKNYCKIHWKELSGEEK